MGLCALIFLATDGGASYILFNLALTLLAVGLSVGASYLMQQGKNKPVARDEKPTTVSSRGSFIPIVLGVCRIGAVFAWAGDRYAKKEKVGGGGKGSFMGGGSESVQYVYYERGWHILCVGPATSLRRIWQNGKVIWEGKLTPGTSPSGSTIQVGAEGAFTIYWGEHNQPTNAELGNNARVGITSRWPHMTYVVWNKRLGQGAVWPLLDYEIEVRPGKSTLVNSPNWMETTPTPLGNIYNIKYAQNGPPGVGYVRISGNHAAEFPAGSLLRIQGQAGSPPNGEWNVLHSDWKQDYVDTNSLDQQMDPRPDAVDALGDTSAWLAPDGVTPAPLWDGNIVSPAYKLVTLSDNPLDPGGYQPNPQGWVEPTAASYSLHHKYRFSVEVLLTATSSNYLYLSLAESLGGINPYPDVARGMFDLGVPTFDFYPKTGAVTGFSEDLGGGWRRFTIEFTIGSALLNNASVRIDAGRGFPAEATSYNSVLYVRKPAVFIEEGTTIFFESTLSGVVPNVGTVEGMERGLDGANAAHVIDQLLFAPYPHGAALDRSDFDMASLEAIGVALGAGGERLLTHVIANEGEEIQQTIVNIMLDIGMMLSWDPQLGKFRFVLVRAPGANLPSISNDVRQGPLPEIETLLEDRHIDKLVYSFPDRSRNYRDTTTTIDDDGQQRQRGNQRARNVRLSIPTDFSTAHKIAERRSQEDLAPPTRYKVYGSRAARLLYPGQAIEVVDVNEVLRVLEVTPDLMTDKVTIDALVDSYGAAASTFEPEQGGGEAKEPAQPIADLAVGIIEVSRYLHNDRAMRIIIPRIRGSNQVVGASLHISRDNATYTEVGVDANIHTGGTLVAAVAAGGLAELEEGFEIAVQGVDSNDVQDLSASLDNWRAGRQVAVVGDEIMFVRNATLTAPGRMRLDGVLRGRLGTKMAAHGQGAQVFVFQFEEMLKVNDILLAPKKTIYVKSQPRTTVSFPIDSVTAVSKTLKGLALAPLNLVNLTTSNMSKSFATGQDVPIVWNYRSTEIPRTGAGMQGFGEVVTSSPFVGEFVLKIKDGGGVVKRTVVGLTAPTYLYTNANMVADFAGEPASFVVEVYAAEAGLVSDTETMTVTRV